MSLPRPKTTRTRTLSEGASAPSAASRVAVDTIAVRAVTACVIGGVRRMPGEYFAVPVDRADALAQLGYVMPDAYFEMMHPAAAAMWREAGAARMGLLESSLAVSPDVVTQLWDGEGRILTPDGVPSHYTADTAPATVRVLQLTAYDPGSSVYRYHSAANTAPGMRSALVRYGYSNPHCHLRQWDGELHRTTVELLAMTADVIHVHMDWRTLHHDLRYDLQANQRAAITYHGSVPDDVPGKGMTNDDADRRMGAIRFGARPYHARYGVEHYLPIPVPVRDYAALANTDAAQAARAGGTFRVAHSPTKRAIKGTHTLLVAVEALQRQGVAIEAVLIEDKPHGEALAIKAGCHATFDSFWLGMQGSGIEGAAMGQAVIAGDARAAEEAAALNGGDCPWTFADDEPSLIEALRRLATDARYRASEAERVGNYVRRVHDYAAVGARYRDILTQAN